MEIDVKTVVGICLQATLFLLMFSIGLKEGVGNISFLWKRPSLLVRSLVAALLLVPLAVMAIDAILPLDEATRMGLGAMAICPGAPMLYRKLVKRKANAALAGSFQVTTSLCAIVAIPLWVWFFDVVYAEHNTAPIGAIARQIATVQLIPILLGLAIRQWMPQLAENLWGPLDKVGAVLLICMLVIVVVAALPKVTPFGMVNVLGIVLFVAATFVIGHFLGGGDPETRISLALANSSRNSGLALVLVALNVPVSGPILGTIGATAALSALVEIIYIRLYRRRLSSTESTAGEEIAPPPNPS